MTGVELLSRKEKEILAIVDKRKMALLTVTKIKKKILNSFFFYFSEYHFINILAAKNIRVCH